MISSALYWIAAGIFFHLATNNKNYWWGLTGISMVVLAIIEAVKTIWI